MVEFVGHCGVIANFFIMTSDYSTFKGIISQYKVYVGALLH